MKAKSQGPDIAKWVGVLIIVVAIVIGNAYYSAVSLPLRATVIIIAGIAAIALALTTVKGRAAFGFIKEARLEMRKVVWPTRQETVQTTLMIAGIVLLMSLILWGVDSFFAYIVSSVLI